MVAARAGMRQARDHRTNEFCAVVGHNMGR
jgi:hypothetical protein